MQLDVHSSESQHHRHHYYYYYYHHHIVSSLTDWLECTASFSYFLLIYSFSPTTLLRDPAFNRVNVQGREQQQQLLLLHYKLVHGKVYRSMKVAGKFHTAE